MIVVTGATGNVGRPLVRALAAAGEEVTAVSRQLPSSAHPLDGVRHATADLADPAGLTSVLDGAEALHLLIAGGSEHVDPHRVLDAAKSGGVRRVVLQSSQIVGTRPGAASHLHLAAFEDAVRRSGLGWTILRPGGFHSNAFMWAESVRSHRTVAAPFPDTGLPAVDPADIAEVAALALRDPAHAERTYELTGPAPVSPREQARAIGDAVGSPIRFVALSRDAARAELSRFMPEPVVDGTLGILGEPSPAEQRVSPAVEQLLRRPPRTFADWAARNSAAFR
ncbi:NAD(P)H-binding protein [Streptomyces sp. NPDC059161]|uniref:NAD(P)H-binding protein n=1 Tax=Streptomyces sp. NPDC059161 TaxID=3346749 RepID=UPI003695658B